MSVVTVALKEIVNSVQDETTKILFMVLILALFSAWLIYTGCKDLKKGEAQTKFGQKLVGGRADLFNKIKIGFGVLLIVQGVWMLWNYFL